MVSTRGWTVQLNPSRTLEGGCQITRPSIAYLEAIMSVQAISWVIDQSKHKANPFIVLLMIANHARSDGTGAWPSIRTLSKECRLGERTVQRAIRKLARSGELRVQTGKGPYGANLYDVTGVNLTPPGVKRDREGCQIEHSGGVKAVSPNPSFKRTVHKDNYGNFYVLGPEGIRRIIGPGEAAQYGVYPQGE